MVKRYLGAALVAFVLGCVGPLTVSAAQAAEEPDDAPSLLGSVTDTVGGLTSGDANAGSDVDAPDAVAGGPGPAPEPGDAAPAVPGPEPAAPGPDTAPAPDADGAGGTGVLGAVTTTVNRLADAPRSLLTDVANAEPPTPNAPTPEVPRPEAPTPDLPVLPDVPTPEPPADTPARPEKPEAPQRPGPNEKPEIPETPPVNTSAGPPANAAPAAPAVPGVDQSVTELEQTGPPPAQQSITQPDTAEPERTESQRPQQDLPAFPDPTASTGDKPADQDKPAAPPPQDVRAETISLRQVTQTPFVLAIALLTAVGVVTVRRVITVK